MEDLRGAILKLASTYGEVKIKDGIVTVYVGSEQDGEIWDFTLPEKKE